MEKSESTSKFEYVLGPYNGGYEILEHTLNPMPHEFEAGCLFLVNDSGMSDGDGAPAKMNEGYKQIP